MAIYKNLINISVERQGFVKINERETILETRCIKRKTQPVQDLIRKIEADAETRLKLPPNSTTAENLACYKGFLNVQTHRLKILHRGGAGGLEICRGRAAVLDALLRHLWESARDSLSPQAQREFPPTGAGGHRRLWPGGTEPFQRH